jgi:hypothetical protein
MLRYTVWYQYILYLCSASLWYIQVLKINTTVPGTGVALLYIPAYQYQVKTQRRKLKKKDPYLYRQYTSIHLFIPLFLSSHLTPTWAIHFFYLPRWAKRARERASLSSSRSDPTSSGIKRKQRTHGEHWAVQLPRFTTKMLPPSLSKSCTGMPTTWCCTSTVNCCTTWVTYPAVSLLLPRPH